MKSATSVLSLASEELIDVSAQYKLVTLLLPRTTLLLPVVIFPDGELDLPALRPIHVLLAPVEIPNPAAYPYTVLLSPVVTACNAC